MSIPPCLVQEHNIDIAKFEQTNAETHNSELTITLSLFNVELSFHMLWQGFLFQS